MSLTAALATHMYSNTMLYLGRCKINAKAKKESGGNDDEKKKKQSVGSAELKAHRWAGYMVSMSIFGNVFVTRLGAVWMLPEPSVYNYGFVGSVFDVFPVVFKLYLCVFGMAGGWHLIYGTRSAIAVLTGSSVVRKPVPIPLKVMAMGNHIAIVAAMFALGTYMTTIDMSEMEDIRNKYFEEMGLH